MCYSQFLKSRENMNWLGPLLYAVRLSYHILACHRYALSNLILSRDSHVAILGHRLGFILFLLKAIQQM